VTLEGGAVGRFVWIIQVPEGFFGVFAGILLVCVGGSLYVGLKRGTQGPNRFGPDPLAAPIPA
jgi:hypothetical protein